MPLKKSSKGLVFNIQRFTVHDGPGIRTEVFLKGCPLKCRWCSNPEGIKPFREVGVYSDRCLGIDKCGLCLEACPKAEEGALIVAENKIVGLERSVCDGCQACAEVCPSPNTMKIWGREMTVSDVVDVILADCDFYERSGGGVTLSGGEVFFQWKFALEILKECKLHKLHTCVESTLHCKSDLLEEAYPWVDLVITDIKHMDPSIHKELTGITNQLILKNIKKTAQLDVPLVIRIPVVAENNNSEKNIRSTAEFIEKELKNNVTQVQLIPFRELGVDKYKSLGLEYPMHYFQPPKREDWEKNIKHLVALMKSYGVPAVAGTSSKIE